MRIREIRELDVTDLFEVRVATRENILTLEELAGLGITPDTVLVMLNKTHRGWLCVVDDRIVGFAMGNRENGELWVIALLPSYEGRGIGAALLTQVEEWLWSEGWSEIWLTTDIDEKLRAYGFYLQQGWVDHVIKDDLRYMRKSKPDRPILRG